jgi:hypothetical protein
MDFADQKKRQPENHATIKRAAIDFAVSLLLVYLLCCVKICDEGSLPKQSKKKKKSKQTETRHIVVRKIETGRANKLYEWEKHRTEQKNQVDEMGGISDCRKTHRRCAHTKKEGVEK